jgi:hypothetical protein
MRSAEVADIALDLVTRAPKLGPDGAPYAVFGREAAIQLCWAALRRARSEFFMDLDDPDDLPLEENEDVPAEQAWLGAAALTAAEIQAGVRRVLLAVPGVVSVPQTEVDLSAEARRPIISVTVVIGFDDDPARAEVISG